VWFIRRYIRRALMLEQQKYGVVPAKPAQAPSIVETFIEPVRVGVVDLRNLSKAAPTPAPVAIRAAQRERLDEREAEEELEPRTAGQFLRKYRLFLFFIVVVLAGLLGAWIYFHTVLGGSKKFQITDVHIQAETAPTP
jgi:hypothetical protein